jgi:SNF family Na+-dependent transporter
VIFGIAHGVMDELDFWGGTFALVLFATVEVIVFGWVFGIDRAWKETHFGADIKVPLIFKFVIKYVTSTILIAILITWTVQIALPTLRMEGILPENRHWILGTRFFLVLFVAVLTFMIFRAWRGRELPAIDNEVDKELAP